ncbi:MAG: hypothetical protein ACE5JP_07725 [Candidatus Bipolaricaulia bacterium]
MNRYWDVSWQARWVALTLILALVVLPAFPVLLYAQEGQEGQEGQEAEKGITREQILDQARGLRDKMEEIRAQQIQLGEVLGTIEGNVGFLLGQLDILEELERLDGQIRGLTEQAGKLEQANRLNQQLSLVSIGGVALVFLLVLVGGS